MQDPARRSWLEKVVLLHKVARSSSEQKDEAENEIEVLTAKNKCGPFFLILDSGEEVVACDVPRFENDLDPEVFFPCHESCLRIVEMVADGRAQRDGGAIKHVYEILERELAVCIKVNNKVQPVTNLRNTGKYGTLWQVQELEWRSYLEGTEVS